VSDLNESGARSLFGLRKRAPKRPVSVTIILAVVLAFLFLSGPRDLTQESAVSQARAFVTSKALAQCGAIVGVSDGLVARITTENGNLERFNGNLERFDVTQIVRLADGNDVPVLVQVWPGIRLGPRIPFGQGRSFTLFEFDDGVDATNIGPAC